jgi:hypothetical protein
MSWHFIIFEPPVDDDVPGALLCPQQRRIGHKGNLRFGSSLHIYNTASLWILGTTLFSVSLSFEIVFQGSEVLT